MIKCLKCGNPKNSRRICRICFPDDSNKVYENPITGYIQRNIPDAPDPICLACGQMIKPEEPCSNCGQIIVKSEESGWLPLVIGFVIVIIGFFAALGLISFLEQMGW